MDLSVNSDESNMNIFDNNTTNDYPVIEHIIDEDMINADNPDEIIDIIDINKHNDTIIDNNKHKDTLLYKSYTTIYRKQYQRLLWVCY